MQSSLPGRPRPQPRRRGLQDSSPAPEPPCLPRPSWILAASGGQATSSEQSFLTAQALWESAVPFPHLSPGLRWARRAGLGAP